MPTLNRFPAVTATSVAATLLLGFLASCHHSSAKVHPLDTTFVYCSVTTSENGTKSCEIKQNIGNCALDMIVYYEHKPAGGSGLYKGHIEATVVDHKHSSPFGGNDKWWERLAALNDKGQDLFVWSGNDDNDSRWNWDFGVSNPMSDVTLNKKTEATYAEAAYTLIQSVKSEGSC